MTKLFYVVGASGIGKDSILNFARQQIAATKPVIFCHRYITRSMRSGGENHIELSVKEFHNRCRHGCFAMHWYSHNHHYGIGIEINHWMQQGMHVVMNGSRQYFNQAASDFPNIIPVEITASDAVLRDRLRQRGRENAEDVDERIKRSRSLDRIVHPQLVRIDNNSKIEAAGFSFIEVIKQSVRNDFI